MTSEQRSRVAYANRNDRESRKASGFVAGLLEFLRGGYLGEQYRRQAMLMSTVLHTALFLILALIILPSPARESLTVVTSEIEPEELEETAFETLDLQIETDSKEQDEPLQLDDDRPFVVEIDVNDLDLNLPDAPSATDVATEPVSPRSEGALAGRSKADRSELVARRGGNAASESAVQRGLEWLAHHQYPDGGWSFDHSRGECNGRCTQPGMLSADCRNAATGFALLTMLGAGQTPFDGEFQGVILRGFEFLLQNSAVVPAGLDLRGKHAGNTGMYTQAIAATALCEVLAMIANESNTATTGRQNRRTNKQRLALIKQLRPAAQGSISFIVNAQHQSSGSWGYEPGKLGDTSILGWQIMALQSASHAIVRFPLNTIIGANQFLDSVQTSDGWYGYLRPERKPSTTAIGILSRMLSGVKREDPRLRQSVAHLSANGPIQGQMYYNYYATQVMMHYGGEEWKKWNSIMRDLLVETQVQEGHATGSWDVSDSHGHRGGRLYMTCLCTMTLEVYYRHLPLYGEPDEIADH